MENYTNASDGSVICVRPVIDQFPSNVLYEEGHRNKGIVVAYAVVTLYMIYGLILVCERYFVPTMQCICHILKLQPNVAGATFMACGSSSPEFFTAVVGTTVTKDNIGFGTLVGSAAFNLTFVVGFISVLIGKAGRLDKWPYIRDIVSYILSVLVVTLVVMDGLVYTYEAFILIFLYVMYIVLMYFNPMITDKLDKLFPEKDEDIRLSGKTDENVNLASVSINSTKSFTETNYNSTSEKDHTETDLQDTDEKKPPSTSLETKNEEELVFPDPGSPFTRPESVWIWPFWIIQLPLAAVLYITVPDCRKPRWRKWFMVTFVMSVLWLALLAYIMIWTASIVGYILGISDEIMALVFLGPATSIPDLTASLLVAREGYWGMAVSTCVGSNVFELLLCLGLSYFLASLLSEDGNLLYVYSERLLYISTMLLGTIVVTTVVIVANGWKVDRKIGVLLILFYLLFLAVALMEEFGVFGGKPQPLC